MLRQPITSSFVLLRRWPGASPYWPSETFPAFWSLSIMNGLSKEFVLLLVAQQSRTTEDPSWIKKKKKKKGLSLDHFDHFSHIFCTSDTVKRHRSGRLTSFSWWRVALQYGVRRNDAQLVDMSQSLHYWKLPSTHDSARLRVLGPPIKNRLFSKCIHDRVAIRNQNNRSYQAIHKKVPLYSLIGVQDNIVQYSWYWVSWLKRDAAFRHFR